MNHVQRMAIALGCGLVLVASAFLPWRHTYSQVSRPAGYHAVFFPPKALGNAPFGVALDLERLLVEYVIIGALTGALFFAASRR